MLYVMEWKFKTGPDYLATGFRKFLSTGAPFPEGATIHGRYHAPGSAKGWIVVESDDIAALYEHAAEWGELLEWETTPVMTDDQAGRVASKLFA